MTKNIIIINKMEEIKQNLVDLSFNELKLKEQNIVIKINKLRKELYDLDKEKDEVKMYKTKKCEHNWKKLYEYKNNYKKCIYCDIIDY